MNIPRNIIPVPLSKLKYESTAPIIIRASDIIPSIYFIILSLGLQIYRAEQLIGF